MGGGELVARDRGRSARGARSGRPLRPVELLEARGDRPRCACLSRAALREPHRPSGRHRRLHAAAERSAAASRRTSRSCGARRTGSCSSPGRRSAPRPRVAREEHAARRVGLRERRHVGLRVPVPLGPKARDVLDLDFAYMQAREIAVGDVPCIASRVTYVGELGWELYCPAEYGLELWDTLCADGVTPGGYRAIDALRLEKGYRAWASDLNAETTPYEAGLGFAVKPDKGEFIGAPRCASPHRSSSVSCSRSRARSRSARSPCAPRAETIVGRVTSGGFGYAVRASIALAYVPLEQPSRARSWRSTSSASGSRRGARGAALRPEGRAGQSLGTSSSDEMTLRRRLPGTAEATTPLGSAR